MPPYAGQAADSGIVDAQNLAWKLELFLKKEASPELLETYESERLPVDTFVAEASGKAAYEWGSIMWNKDSKTASSVARTLHIMSGFGYVYDGEVVVPETTWPLGGLTWRKWSMPSILLKLDGRPRSRAPHVFVEKDAEKISTTDLFGKEFVILAGAEGRGWLDAAKRVGSDLRVKDMKSYCMGPDGDLVDKNKNWEPAAGTSSTRAFLVRPDGFVAWRERKIHIDCEKRLEEVMRQSLCVE